MPASTPLGAARWSLALAFGMLACGGDSTDATDGFILVITTTTGAALDADGYAVSVDEAAQEIEINDELSINGVTPGSHSVALSGVAANCTLDGTNPRIVTVDPGTPTEVDFNVSCAPPLTGRLVFETLRTGDFEVFSMNPDGTDAVNLSETPPPTSSPTGRPMEAGSPS